LVVGGRHWGAMLKGTGQCFGIGNTVRASLVHIEKTGAPYCEMEELYPPHIPIRNDT
jgi:hypothetical protein